MNLRDKFKILTYNVGIIRKPIGDILKSGINKGDIQWLSHPHKDRFFADPFLWHEDDENYYILCEEYMFFEEKGKITLLTISKRDFKLLERKIIIEEKTHLSFPYCQVDSDYIIPESSASGKSKVYFFKDGERISEKVMFDEGLIDTSFYKDASGQTWMFTAKTKIPSTELYLYRLDGEKWIPVHNNPIISNNRVTRSAGRFFEYNGKVYRPVQDCKGRYGRQTKILEIKNVSEEGVIYEEAQTLNSFENPPYDETFHTFNTYGDFTIVDGSKDFVRFPAKIAYKWMRWMFWNRIHS